MGKMMNFAHINACADFEKILQHYNLEYTRKGDQLRLLCPFHDDTDPSLSITLVETDKAKANTFHCFGCGASGSPIDFVKEMDGCDLRDAAQKVAELSGSALAPPRSRGGKQRGRKKPSEAQEGSRKQKTATNPPKRRKSRPEASEPVSEDVSRTNTPLKFALDLDLEHEHVLARLDPEAAEHFGVGYLADTSRSMMKGRICIPIHNPAGELVAYVGRWPTLAVPEGEDKYRFPPKFEKLAELYNVHRLNGAQHIVAVEGFFSAMRLDQLGVPVVALMGTAISPKQIELLVSRGVKSVLVMLDGDKPGQAAAEVVASAVAEHLFVRVVRLPPDQAPDDMPEQDLQRYLPYPLRNRF